jgi:hypothetical protein
MMDELQRLIALMDRCQRDTLSALGGTAPRRLANWQRHESDLSSLVQFIHQRLIDTPESGYALETRGLLSLETDRGPRNATCFHEKISGCPNSHFAAFSDFASDSCDSPNHLFTELQAMIEARCETPEILIFPHRSIVPKLYQDALFDPEVRAISPDRSEADSTRLPPPPDRSGFPPIGFQAHLLARVASP